MSSDIHQIYEGFRRDVAAFIEATGTAKTTLGIRALNDPGFVAGLNSGRTPRPETIQRVRDYMDSVSK